MDDSVTRRGASQQGAAPRGAASASGILNHSRVIGDSIVAAVSA